MQRTANENAACLRRICKRSDQPKIERLVNNDARLILSRKLNGQRHDRVQTESQIATVDSCLDLVGSLQQGVASCEVFSWSTDIHKPTIYMQMVMTSDETQIQIPQENHGQTMLKMSSISDLKRPTAPKILNS